MPLRRGRRIKKSTSNDPKNAVCAFCFTNENDELKAGKLIVSKNITAHYYCMLFSSALQQGGATDSDGLLGFLPQDIVREVHRGKRFKCSVCRKSGATIGCCNKSCRKVFHFPCSLDVKTLHIFYGSFETFCTQHIPRNLLRNENRKSITNSLCNICLTEVTTSENLDSLVPPCCLNGVFHKLCIQKQALVSGYFFKCPLCNNKEQFQTFVQERGVYIPEQDAAWELEQGAFEDLYERHSRCDAPNCLCPKGNDYDVDNTKWEVVLCSDCGSEGCHVECGNIPLKNPTWKCNDCINTMKTMKEKAAEIRASKSTKRKKIINATPNTPPSTRLNSLRSSMRKLVNNESSSSIERTNETIFLEIEKTSRDIVSLESSKTWDNNNSLETPEISDGSILFKALTSSPVYLEAPKTPEKTIISNGQQKLCHYVSSDSSSGNEESPDIIFISYSSKSITNRKITPSKANGIVNTRSSSSKESHSLGQSMTGITIKKRRISEDDVAVILLEDDNIGISAPQNISSKQTLESKCEQAIICEPSTSKIKAIGRNPFISKSSSQVESFKEKVPLESLLKIKNGFFDKNPKVESGKMAHNKLNPEPQSQQPTIFSFFRKGEGLEQQNEKLCETNNLKTKYSSKREKRKLHSNSKNSGDLMKYFTYECQPSTGMYLCKVKDT